MVLSNKKHKQKLREAKSELLLASESQNNSSKAQESVQSLLITTGHIPRLSKRKKRREKIQSLGEKKTEFFGQKSEKIESLGEKSESLLKRSAQIPRLSKREKRGEKIESLGEKSASFGEKSELLGEKIEYFGEKIESLSEKSDSFGEKSEYLGENVDVLGENEWDGEIKKEKRKKRKRGDVGNGEVKEVKRDNVTKTKKKKKKKLRKKKKKVENGELEKMDVVKGVGGNGEHVVVETSRTMVGFNYESKENLEPCTKVYVGGIPFYSTEDDIRSYFEGCGTITEIDCMKFPESGKFRGIAIITFKHPKELWRLMDQTCKQHCDILSTVDMGGLYLKIQPYKSERANKASPFAPAIVEAYNRIFVGNLAWDITEDDLRTLFSSCNIASIRFGLDKETMEFKGYGHVDFADSESVKTALKLDQNVVCGRPIRISCAVAKKGAVTGSTLGNKKTVSNQLKSEDEVNHEQTQILISRMAAILVRRRTCYECGEKGHLSSDCPKKQATDQENPITMSCDVAKNGAITGSTPWQQKTSEDSKPLEQSTYTNHPYGNDTSEVAPVPQMQLKSSHGKNRETSIPILREEIIFNILILLRADVLYTVMRRMSEWRDHRDPQFVSTHFLLSSSTLLMYCRERSLYHLLDVKECHAKRTGFEFRLPSGIVVSTCNGLMLILKGSSLRAHCAYYVTNPITRRTLVLPRLSLRIFPTSCSLAFEASSKVYKVVMVYKTENFSYDKVDLGCAILTVGVDKAWRVVNCAHLSKEGMGLLYIRPPVTSTDFVYWRPTLRPYILALDLKSECIKLISLPYDAGGCRILPKGNSISIWYPNSDCSMEVWVLKDYISEEWVKILYIEGEPIRNEMEKFFSSNEFNKSSRAMFRYDCIRPRSWLGNGERILFHARLVWPTFVHDLKTQSFAVGLLCGRRSSPPLSACAPFVNSLAWV
ncbi:hypothetical protein Leryth_008645 [Lithospermum erythrorhizon]|nr:hypothetical protein Leryth_008645 [Lithospermum erythrorhizon]